jgi:hypothetical protein
MYEPPPPFLSSVKLTAQVPKRKPQLTYSKPSSTQPPQPPAQPKKFSPFSLSDSKSLESEYQKLLEAVEVARTPDDRDTRRSSRKRKAGSGNLEAKTSSVDTVHVPVNEDFLFDVDIKARELAPVYWLGPVYEGQYKSALF